MSENNKTEFKFDLEEGEKIGNNFVLKDSYEEKGLLAKIKDNIGKIVMVLLLVLCIIGILSLWGALYSTKVTVAELSKKIEGIDLKAIKAQIGDLESRIEGLKKENEGLRAELTSIKNEMENIKAMKAKPAQPQAQKHNKTVKPKRR
ncbi:MAG: hypothetical protein N3D15_06760 [Syntrophorhabdaceae bacterium]|nr:hypothetical protein [Syntrophorhabdaceae bacterium]